MNEVQSWYHINGAGPYTEAQFEEFVHLFGTTP